MTDVPAHDPAIVLLREVASSDVPGAESLVVAAELAERPVSDLLTTLIREKVAQNSELAERE